MNDIEYKVIKLLGHGKGGYSYLVEKDNQYYVLKQIHLEFCDYYTYGDTIDVYVKKNQMKDIYYDQIR